MLPFTTWEFGVSPLTKQHCRLTSQWVSPLHYITLFDFSVLTMIILLFGWCADRNVDEQNILREASAKIRSKYNIYEMTLQLERYHMDMNACQLCKPPAKWAATATTAQIDFFLHWYLHQKSYLTIDMSHQEDWPFKRDFSLWIIPKYVNESIFNHAKNNVVYLFLNSWPFFTRNTYADNTTVM